MVVNMNSNEMQNGNWANGGDGFGGGAPGGVVPGAVPTMPIQDGMEPEEEPKKQKDISSKKLWVGLTVAFGVLAVIGTTFGIVMMINGNQRSEDLTSQVNELEEENDDLLEQLKNQISEAESKPVTLMPVIAEPADYIYVGEWAIKIKKPENWRNMIREYAFFNDYPQAVDVLEIKEDPEVPTAHALIVNEGTVACEDLTISYDVCFKVANNTYVVTGLPAVGTGGVSDEFRDFVLNSENYLVL